MTYGHLIHEDPYKPNPNIPGGSLPGKPHPKAQWIIKIAADAIVVSSKGGIDAFLKDKRFRIPMAEFERRMNYTLPGWQQYMLETAEGRKTGPVKTMWNRVYHMYVEKKVDKTTGKVIRIVGPPSVEHWINHFKTPQSTAFKLHEGIVRHAIQIENWKDYLWWTGKKREEEI